MYLQKPMTRLATGVETNTYKIHCLFYNEKSVYQHFCMLFLAFSVNQLNEAGDGPTWHGSRGCGIGITETMAPDPTSAPSHRLQCHRRGAETCNKSVSFQPRNQLQNCTLVCVHEIT